MHKDDDAASNLDWRPVTSICCSTLIQRRPNLRSNALNLLWRDLRDPNYLPIQISPIFSCDSTEGEFLVAGHAKLSGEKDIQRDVKRCRYFIGNNDTSTRNSKDGHICAVGEDAQFFGQLPSSILTVFEGHSIHSYLSVLLHPSSPGFCDAGHLQKACKGDLKRDAPHRHHSNIR